MLNVTRPIPLSHIRSLTIKAAVLEFDESTDQEHAAKYPYAYGVVHQLDVGCLRYRTCEDIGDSLDRLPPLPEGIPASAEHGELVEAWGLTFVVLENHQGDGVNEMVLSTPEFVDASS